MRASRNLLPITAAAAASAVVGLVLGRKTSGVNVRRYLNGNHTWLSRQERQLVTALIQAGQGHLFRSWPPPGVRDAEKRRLLAAAAAALGQAASAVEAERLAVLSPPVAAPRPKLLEAHGDTREDTYYWLRDDSRSAPAVLSHLAAENEYTRAVLADTEALQGALYEEMRGRIQEDDTQVPARIHGYFYYTRQAAGQQYGIHCRRRVPAGMREAGPGEADELDESEPEEILLDENARKSSLAADYYSVGNCDTSPDQRLYAWSEDTVGGEKYTIHVKDLSTGASVSRPIPGTSGDFEWAADNATLFYVVKDHLDRPYKVLRHRLGCPSPDVVVFEESDEAFYVGLSKGRSERLIYIHSGSAVTSETRYLPADQPEGEWRVVLPRVQDTEYSVSDRGPWLYLTLRDSQRPNSELLVAPIEHPEQAEVLIPHRRDVKLCGAAVGRDFMVVSERSGGLERARVYRLPGGVEERPVGQLGAGEEITFDEPAYSLSAYLTGDFDSPLLRMSYTSLTTPSTVIDLHMGTGKRCVKKVAPVLGGFDRSRYVTERRWATAADGVKVPISLVYRKGLAKLDGSDPLLLDGYGSYEIPNDPYFSSSRLSLLDRGFIFAIAHVRGGGEMGRYWYEDGKLLRKANTFTDFIAAAGHLVGEARLVTPQRLVIQGRSAGGLLMGAVVNMRPDLFHAAIIGVGFVDSLTTMMDDTIPLTIIEREEWGDPCSDPAVYTYMKSYSPVDNVRPQKYPHVLATAGLHDPRVGYWEAAKLIARLREAATNNKEDKTGGSSSSKDNSSKDNSSPVCPHLLLLKTDMGAGHFSVTGRFERLKEVSLEYAFLLKALGMTGVPLAGGAGAEVKEGKEEAKEAKGKEEEAKEAKGKEEEAKEGKEGKVEEAGAKEEAGEAGKAVETEGK